MKPRLELWLAIPTTVVITLLLLFSVMVEVWLEQKQYEESLREQAYILSEEMQAAWDFMSANQDRINTDGDGTYTFKGLHCSIVGTSIGALFTHRTDYVIRYTASHPRNPRNAPDEFESEAIEFFLSNPKAKEHYAPDALRSDDDYFRYAVPLTMDSGCVSCHGGPKGEIDATGFPKEGMEIGDLVGIASISIPTDQYKSDLAIRIGQRAFLSAGVLAACLLTIILVSRRFVIRPLRKVEGAVQAVASGDLETAIDPDAIGARGEIRTLSKQFNAMTSDLDALHRNLEGLVEVRTEQLAEANDSLAEQARMLEEMNRRLTENDLYKSHFFVMMSHELRTPITAIRAFTAMLADSEDLDRETVSSAIQAIRTNSQSLSRLVDNLLESARMEAGAVKLEKDVVDVGDVMYELSRTLDPLARDKEIAFKAEAGDTPLIMADQGKLLHILENLGSNAIKYTSPGGNVSVRSYMSEDSRYVCFDVEDDGMGISEEDQAIVFDKFVQARNSVSRPVSGSGLGLTLAKEYAELHGGRILLKSTLGKGSLFTVRIPFEELELGFE